MAERVTITHIRAMQGVLPVKGKPRFKTERPRISENDPRYQTINDRISALMVMMEKNKRFITK